MPSEGLEEKYLGEASRPVDTALGLVGVGGGVVGVLGVRKGFCWSRGVTGWWGGVWGRGGAGGFGVRIGVRVGLEVVEGLGFG